MSAGRDSCRPALLHTRLRSGDRANRERVIRRNGEFRRSSRKSGRHEILRLRAQNDTFTVSICSDRRGLERGAALGAEDVAGTDAGAADGAAIVVCDPG
jgi:hypothetical protein